MGSQYITGSSSRLGKLLGEGCKLPGEGAEVREQEEEEGRGGIGLDPR